MPSHSIKKIKPEDVKHEEVEAPQIQGEKSVSGSTPDPESDDNVLKAAQEAGLYEEADEEHPTELNIAEEIEKDEKGR